MRWPPERSSRAYVLNASLVAGLFKPCDRRQACIAEVGLSEETMRNTEMAKLDGLVGEWSMTMSDAWFLEPPTTVPGSTTIAWLGESLLIVRSDFGGGRHVHSEMSLVLGRSDPNDRFVALYQDDRGVCRQFATTFDGEHWTMTREDPDLHQRFIVDVEKDQILGSWEASGHAGKTWRKDFSLTFERT
jgi:hypothetical protein